MGEFDYAKAARDLPSSSDAGADYDFARAAAGAAAPSGDDVPIPTPKPPANALQAVGQAGRRAYDWTKDLFTGENRREFDYPELPTSIAGQFIPGRGNVASLLSLGRDDQQKAGIHQSLFPDAPVSFDRFGNAVATHGGQPYYLNRPGLSGQDFEDFGTQLLFSMPITARLSRMTSGMGLIPRSVGSGAGFTLGGGLQDLAAEANGAPEGPSLGRAAWDFAAGAAGELVSPIFRAGWNKLFGTAPQLVDQAGQPTAQTLRIFQQAGIDPSAVTSDMLQIFQREARTAANPIEAARYAASQSLPVPLPMTRGRMTGLKSDQLFEDNALKGVFGKQAEVTMKGAEADLQDALAANVPAIQGRIANGMPLVTERGQAGAAAQARLDALKGQAKAGVDAAYNAARSAGNASLPRDAFDEFVTGIKSAVAGDHDLAGIPRTSGLLDQLAKLGRGEGDSEAVVRSMFDWRRRASSARAAGGEEAVALGKAIGEFDRRISDALDNSLINGNPEAVSLWRSAISKARDFLGTFKARDLVGQLTARDPQAGFRLTVAPEAASNLIMGRAETGIMSQPELARDLVKMRDLLGPDSPEWNAIRQEVFLRFANRGLGGFDNGVRQFSGVNFKRAWDAANLQNAPVIRELFSSDERALINQFANEAAKATNVTRNTSNSGSAIANALQGFAKSAFAGDRVWAFMRSAFPWAYQPAQGFSALGRVNVLPAQAMGSPGVVGALLGTAAERTYPNQEP